MRKFKYEDGTDGIGYDTLDELLQIELDWIREYGDFYYVKPKSENFYNLTVYKVDKKTGKASYKDYIDYFVETNDKATPVDPETLRRAS